ncbi:MAG: hypothetical protein PHO62_07830 [Sulfurimonas sp.]|uniref:hypothetical protein n=1 Tax=Sulfurimonas sp. TaxID=2022749 RepID=UPI002624DB92|nr:hypothetical protein [Sulfurimonas sp.]MDD5373316.1 hypothetical protein [Sulfurimonas sp.]
MNIITRFFLLSLAFSSGLWAIEVNLPNMGLFSNSTVSASQALSLGDIVGALAVGVFAYATIVLPFVFGIASMSEHILKSENNNGGGAGGAPTLIKFALTPTLWLVGGAMAFAIFHIFLNTFYRVDIYSWINMFLEVRYESAVGRLSASGTMLSTAKSALLVLDVASKVVFWSIPVIFGFLFVSLLLYIVSIFLESSGDDSAFKKAFAGVVAGVVALVIVSMYEQTVSRIMFKQSPVVSPIGSISTARGAFTNSLKYWIRTGFVSRG